MQKLPWIARFGAAVDCRPRPIVETFPLSSGFAIEQLPEIAAWILVIDVFLSVVELMIII
jgi:hypothetical protein